MLETGMVIEVEADRILVCTDSNTKGVNCSTGCTVCRMGNRKKKIWVKKHNRIIVREKDRIEIYYPPGKTIIAAFQILILPVILFFLFYFIAALLFRVQQELFRAIWGVAGIACAFAFNFLVQKIRKNPQLPEITRKIH